MSLYISKFAHVFLYYYFFVYLAFAFFSTIFRFIFIIFISVSSKSCVRNHGAGDFRPVFCSLFYLIMLHTQLVVHLMCRVCVYLLSNGSIHFQNKNKKKQKRIQFIQTKKANKKTTKFNDLIFIFALLVDLVK